MIFIEIFFCKRNTSIGEVIPKTALFCTHFQKALTA